jgi:predicted transcriptional regulator of viral defense system
MYTGVDIMTINDVFTAAEAAELWGLARETVKKACSGQKGCPPRFKPGEYRKTAGVRGDYLVTRAGMIRLYGMPPV